MPEKEYRALLKTNKELKVHPKFKVEEKKKVKIAKMYNDKELKMNKGVGSLNNERIDTNESVHWQISIPPKKEHEDDIPDDITEPDWAPNKTSPRRKETEGPKFTKKPK